MSQEDRRDTLKYQVRQTIRPTIAPLTAAVSGALAASSLQAATITVDTLDDALPSDQCSLRAALYSATTGSEFGTCIRGDPYEHNTIEFQSSLSGTINLSSEAEGYYYDFENAPLLVGQSVTIDGDDRITLEGTGDGPVLNLKYDPDGFTTDSVTLTGLTITGGGGDYGGAIYSKARELQLSGCTLTGNSVAQLGGAILHFHPYPNVSRTSISNSVISGNETTGESSRGGAVAIVTTMAIEHELNVSSSTFENNQAVVSGGAIDFQVPSGLADITSSTFYGNTATNGEYRNYNRPFSPIPAVSGAVSA